MSLPPPDGSWYVRPPDLPERASVGAVVLRPGSLAGWRVAVVVEPGEYFQLPKGGLEPGETHEEALARYPYTGPRRTTLIDPAAERP